VTLAVVGTGCRHFEAKAVSEALSSDFQYLDAFTLNANDLVGVSCLKRSLLPSQRGRKDAEINVFWDS
jgi:hypothetical protein